MAEERAVRHWTTTDIWLANWLAIKGLRFEVTRRADIRQKHFVFEVESPARLRELTAEWVSGNTEARRYADNLKVMKTLVYSDATDVEEDNE